MKEQKSGSAEVRKFFLLLYCFTAYCLLPTGVNAFCFEDAGKTYGINPSLLKSIAKTESNMNPRAVNINKNGSIDIGLMQINSFWIKPLGLDSNKLISDPCYNIMIGAKVLKQCIDRYGYTWEAVGCYNATSAPKRVKYSWKIFNRLKTEQKSEDRSQKTEVEKLRETSQPLNFSTSNPHGSELYFRVRDKTMEAR
jgi:hypothetical protein